jgi:hypothetical protein
VLVRQFRSALLLLLVVTAVVSGLLGERTGATVIGAILAVSVGFPRPPSSWDCGVSPCCLPG